MASMPINGKKLWNQWTDFFGMLHRGPWPIIFCSHYDPGMTLTYFTTRSNFATLAFVQEKALMMEIFAACGLEIG